jgi:hypothetical protein
MTTGKASPSRQSLTKPAKPDHRAAQSANPAAIGAIGQNQDAPTHENRCMSPSVMMLMPGRNFCQIEI